MRAIVFGATGMVGQGVLRECLLDSGVEQVLIVVRRPTGLVGPERPKLRELVHGDFGDFAPVKAQLTGYDACFFALGISAAGLSEADYRRITFDYAVAAGKVLAEANPGMTFVFVSGAGTDPTGKSRQMWARVKGEAETALAAMPFKATYMIRPGLIEPLHGIRSRTRAYRIAYAVMRPFMPILRWALRGQMTTTERLGRTMIRLAREGGEKRVLEPRDLALET